MSEPARKTSAIARMLGVAPTVIHDLDVILRHVNPDGSVSEFDMARLQSARNRLHAAFTECDALNAT